MNAKNRLGRLGIMATLGASGLAASLSGCSTDGQAYFNSMMNAGVGQAIASGVDAAVRNKIEGPRGTNVYVDNRGNSGSNEKAKSQKIRITPENFHEIRSQVNPNRVYEVVTWTDNYTKQKRTLGVIENCNSE